MNVELSFNQPYNRQSALEKDLLANGARTEVKTQLAAAKTGNLALEHISHNDHTAPFIIDVVPIFLLSTRKHRQHIIDSWPDVRPGGNDGRRQTIFPLPFTIQWKELDAYENHFKLLK